MTRDNSDRTGKKADTDFTGSAEKLVDFAASQQRKHQEQCLPVERKERGHYGTPPKIAAYMAGMFSKMPAHEIRVLDAGAGVGVLTAALCDRIAGLCRPRKLFVELWEHDPSLKERLSATMVRCQRELHRQGHELDFCTRTDDFVLSNGPRSLVAEGSQPRFDLVIMNPPYFKLKKDSPHAQAMPHVVHGQPNIYSLFLAVAADLLLSNGELVAITPRSYFNGPYFRRFRRWFFDRMSPRHIHQFESRTDAFREQEVLQENVILAARKTQRRTNVILTTSEGRDFSPGVDKRIVPFGQVIDDSANDCIVRVTSSKLDEEILKMVGDFPHRFRDLGFDISTGPVVTFRATQYLLHEKISPEESAPLLMMHNVRPFRMEFSVERKGKPSHIAICKGSLNLLLPAKRYVLLKRFTAKEERRRLVAGILAPTDCYSPYVGLENHLNYIQRSNDELSLAEAFGLAALFNSQLFDRYFRTISGNTQVNAAEIRVLPLPELSSIVEIGDRIRTLATMQPRAVERVVGNVLGVCPSLVQYLVE